MMKFLKNLFSKKSNIPSAAHINENGCAVSASGETFEQIQEKLELAQKNGESIVSYILQQIQLLECAHEAFLKRAYEQGYSPYNPRVGDIEIQQYTAMKQLAEKANLDTSKYIEKIKEIRIRIFGKENYKRFFSDK